MESFRLALQTHGNLFCKLQIRFRIDGREPKIINLDSSRQLLQTNEKFFFSNLVIIFELLAEKQKRIFEKDSEASI